MPEPENCHQCTVLSGHSAEVHAITISPDGKWLVSSSADGTLRIWQFPSGTLENVVEISGIVADMVFSPTGNIIALNFTQRIEIRSVQDWTLLQVLTQNCDQEPSGTISKIAFSPDGTRLAGTLSEYVHIWEYSTGVLDHILEHDARVTSVAFSPDGRHIASGSFDETVQIWDAATGEPQHLFEHHLHVVRAIVVSPDSKSVVSASDDGTLQRWDIINGQTRGFIEYTAEYTSVAISACGRQILAGSSDGTVQLHDLTLDRQQIFFGHSDAVNAVVFSPCGDYAASGSDDGCVRIWMTRQVEERMLPLSKSHIVVASAIATTFPESQSLPFTVF